MNRQLTIQVGNLVTSGLEQALLSYGMAMAPAQDHSVPHKTLQQELLSSSAHVGDWDLQFRMSDIS